MPWSSLRWRNQHEWASQWGRLAAKIQKDVPSALFVHCFAHCANLCLQSVGCQCASIRDALDLVMETSQLIQYSPKRSSLFSALQCQAKSKSLKLLCPTRWTVRAAAIDAILSNYSILEVALEEFNTETNDEYGRKAGGLLALMEKFRIYFGLNYHIWHRTVITDTAGEGHYHSGKCSGCKAGSTVSQEATIRWRVQ